MIESELPGGAREALEALKTSRGTCPSSERLVAYEAMTPAERERAPEHAHIQICSKCQLVLLHLVEPSSLKPQASRLRQGFGGQASLQWALPLAAVAVLAIGATLFYSRPSESPIETVRGTDIQPVSPTGLTLGTPTFRWQSPLSGMRYRVMVRRGSTVIWTTTVEGSEAAPPSTIVFEPGAEYTWQVEAIDKEGEVRMTSPPQTFVIS